MPIYFASDVHLRPDRPERGRRLARWVGQRSPTEDRLVLVGDLCDFWFASRQRRGLELPCDGLRALADFARRGGDLTILPGNHDAWLGPFYEQALGARFLAAGRLEITCGGQRILATHGHDFGARTLWKHAMESRAFLAAFQALPGAVASGLESLLERDNEARQEARDRAYLDLYRRRVAALAGRYDLVVLGHIHRAADIRDSEPRFVVLGDWKRRASYLRVDEASIAFVIED